MRVINSRFRECTSLVPRQMIMVFGMGTRLHVRMCTTLENGVLRHGQQPQSAFIDQGEVETLRGCETARCDEHPFRAKIKVSA